MSKQNNLTEIWNVYSDSIIKEGKTVTRPIEGGIKKMGSKPGPGAVDLNSKEAKKIQNTGNEGNTDPNYDIEGLEEPIDPKNTKGKENLYEPEKYSSEKFDKKVEKSYKESININMKSVFDKLFEEVMDGQESNEELDALGIDTGDEGAGEESGDITITLDKDMAKQLCDILQAAMGDEEADDAEVEDYEEMEESEDEDQEEVEEAVEAEDLGHSLVNAKDSGLSKVGAGSNKVKNTQKVSSGKAEGKVKGQTGDAAELKDGKAELTGKNNKSGSGTVASAGASLFD
jgi:hypothetical protein